MPETTDAESQAKLGELLDFHRQHGARLQEVLWTLPDGGWVSRDTVSEGNRRQNPDIKRMMIRRLSLFMVLTATTTITTKVSLLEHHRATSPLYCLRR
jgi:hypothetical protein